jgi:hypothetical protein
MAQNGLPAGDYWLDTQGYWGVMGNWQPLGNINPGSTVSRYGSGEQGSNGWSHYDNSQVRGWEATTTVATTPAIGRIADAGATAT